MKAFFRHYLLSA